MAKTSLSLPGSNYWPGYTIILNGHIAIVNSFQFFLDIECFSGTINKVMFWFIILAGTLLKEFLKAWLGRERRGQLWMWLSGEIMKTQAGMQLRSLPVA
jgi:hypothetical protein